jgi:hypothetical protein
MIVCKSRSSATDSSRSALSGTAATNWNTCHLSSDTATPEEGEQAAGTARRLITAAENCFPNYLSSAKTGSYE